MANIKTPENFFDALTHRISSIENPEFEGFRTQPRYLSIYSVGWRISVMCDELNAKITCSSSSTQKSYALTLLACIEAVEEYNKEPCPS